MEPGLPKIATSLFIIVLLLHVEIEYHFFLHTAQSGRDEGSRTMEDISESPSIAGFRAY
jgi:hypothetical protein